MAKCHELDPTLLQATTALTQVRLPILLQKAISVSRLRGVIVELTKSARITNVNLSPAIAAAGFEIMLGPLGSNLVKFEIARPAGNMGDLPEGELLALELAVGSAIETVAKLGIEGLHAEPPMSLCGATNAVIVPAP